MKRRVWIPLCLAGVLTLSLFAMVSADKDVPDVEHQRFPVTVRVDFGPLDKEGREERLMVDKGSTPKDVVSLLYPIRSGETCCNTREVKTIDGVSPDPAKNRWWNCRLNGSTKVGPFRTELKAEDLVEWVYVERPQ